MGISSADVSSKESAQDSLAAIDGAIEKVSGQRALLGATQNRLNSTVANLQVSVENMSAANSRIRDVDYAEETAKQARNQIISSAGTSVLAQANMSSQNALKLIA
jgi:flagellin